MKHHGPEKNFPFIPMQIIMKFSVLGTKPPRGYLFTVSFSPSLTIEL
jgi:hypothetical protein